MLNIIDLTMERELNTTQLFLATDDEMLTFENYTINNIYDERAKINKNCSMIHFKRYETNIIWSTSLGFAFNENELKEDYY